MLNQRVPGTREGTRCYSLTPRQVETCAAYRKRLAQGGESSSRPTHALPVNPISTQTESAVIKALRDYNQMLIEQNQILMEQNQLLLKRVATLEGQVGSQGEQMHVLFERIVDFKKKSLKGRKVRGLIMGNTRADRERLDSHGEKITMLHWRVHQLEEAPGQMSPTHAPEAAPAPAPPELEEESDEEPEEIPEEEPEKEEEEPEEAPEFTWERGDLDEKQVPPSYL
ncbi:hypothetical protein Hanom_Chr11g01056081 [Helianthus anomalus]